MSGKKSLAKNKKAFAMYEILEKFEAGIMLTGAEVKSCRSSNLNLKGSYISIQSGEAFIKEMHISKYSHSHRDDHNPTRTRKLLLHKKEIDQLESAQNTQGITIIPLELYLSKGLIKLSIALAKGKKQHDRRQDLKRKDENLQIKRALKRFQ